MNNSCYGETLESKQQGVKRKLVKTREAILENCDKGLLKTINIFGKNLVAIKSRRAQIYWDRPTLVGAGILDLAKFHVYEFHCKVSMKRQNLQFYPQDSKKEPMCFPSV